MKIKCWLQDDQWDSIFRCQLPIHNKQMKQGRSTMLTLCSQLPAAAPAAGTSTAAPSLFGAAGTCTRPLGLFR
jgi:hypothetical protein